MVTKTKPKAAKKPLPAKKTVVAKKPVPKKASAKVAPAKPMKKAAMPVKKAASPKANVAVKQVRKKVAPIPKGHSSVTPYLIVNDAKKAMDFYAKVFGAKTVMKMDKPGGKIGHAELKIGDSRIMLADEHPEMGARAPHSIGGSAVGIHLYIKNVDAVVKTAVAAGAKLLMPVQDMYYGDRSGSIEDPAGHKWHISTHIEDVTPAVMRKRAADMASKK